MTTTLNWNAIKQFHQAEIEKPLKDLWSWIDRAIQQDLAVISWRWCYRPDRRPFLLSCRTLSLGNSCWFSQIAYSEILENISSCGIQYIQQTSFLIYWASLPIRILNWFKKSMEDRALIYLWNRIDHRWNDAKRCEKQVRKKRKGYLNKLYCDRTLANSSVSKYTPKREGVSVNICQQPTHVPLCIPLSKHPFMLRVKHLTLLILQHWVGSLHFNNQQQLAMCSGIKNAKEKFI